MLNSEITLPSWLTEEPEEDENTPTVTPDNFNYSQFNITPTGPAVKNVVDQNNSSDSDSNGSNDSEFSDNPTTPLIDAGNNNSNSSTAAKTAAAAATALGAATGNPNLAGGAATYAASQNKNPNAPASASPSTVQTVQGDLGLTRSAAGLVGDAAKAGLLGSDSSAIGSAAGDVGEAAGIAAIPLDVYNFVKNYQSGATGSDALSGAETGAAVGSVIPVVGTALGALLGGAVGAISSAFGGGRPDPETEAVDSVDAQGTGVMSGANPATSFTYLAGVMDAKNNSPGHSAPIEQVFGRMGEGNLLNQMAGQINSALASGVITSDTNPTDVYNNVVAPWLKSKGAAIDPNSVDVNGNNFGKSLIQSVQNLIGSYMNGSLTSKTPIGIKGQVDSSLPTFAGTTQGLAKGGPVKNQKFMGEMCTKDCSGHAAGYAWGKAHPDSECDGNSESFNEGCDIASEEDEQSLAKGGEVLPTVSVIPNGATYNDMDDAAQAMATAINQAPGPGVLEQGGVIVRTPSGKYQLSTTTSGVHDMVKFGARIPKGYQIAAIVHSHPTTMESGQYFSPGDIAVANQLNVPSYIQFDASDSLNKYIPGKTKLEQRLNPGGPGYADITAGDPVLAQQIVTAKYMQPVPATAQTAAPVVASTSPAPTAQPTMARGGEVNERAAALAAIDKELQKKYGGDFAKRILQYHQQVSNAYANGQGFYGNKTDKSLKRSNGGPINNKMNTNSRLKNIQAYLKLRGFAAGGDVSDDDDDGDDTTVIPPPATPAIVAVNPPAQNASAPAVPNAPVTAQSSDGGAADSMNGQEGATTSVLAQYPKTSAVTAAILARFGGVPGPRLQSATAQVVGLFASNNPKASDDALSQNMSNHLPTVLAASTPGVNVTTNPETLQEEQAGVNAQRTAAQAQVQRNMGSMADTLYNMRNIVGPGEAERATEEYINQPLIGANIQQENVNNAAATQNKALQNQGIDIENQGKLQEDYGKQLATKEAALNLGNAAQANESGGLYSPRVVESLQQQVIATGQPGAVKFAQNLTGMSAVQAEAAVKAFLGAGQQAQTIIATAAAAAASNAQAGLIRAQIPAENANSAVTVHNVQQSFPGLTIPGVTPNKSATREGAPNQSAPTSNQTLRAGQINPETGVKVIPYVAAAYLVNDPGQQQLQKDFDDTGNKLGAQGNTARANRLNSAEAMMNLLTPASKIGFGPIQNYAYNKQLPIGKNMKGIWDQYNRLSALYKSNARAMGNSLGSQEIGGDELPSLSQNGTLQSKQQALANLMGVDAKDQYLENQYIKDLQNHVMPSVPLSQIRNSLHSYVLLNKDGTYNNVFVFGKGPTDVKQEQAVLKMYKNNPNYKLIDAG